MSLIEPVVLPEDLAAQLEPLRPLAAPVAAVVDLLLKSLPRLSDRPDARSSRVVDLRQSLVYSPRRDRNLSLVGIFRTNRTNRKNRHLCPPSKFFPA